MRLLTVIAACLGFLAIPRLIPMRPASLSVSRTAASYSPQVQSAIANFRNESRRFAAACTSLRLALASVQPGDRHSIAAARQQLIATRRGYKMIESFLEYFFRSSATIYNRPPKFEAEDGGMEYQSPIGLQVIESILYDPHPDKKELLAQAKAVESSAADLPALLYDLKADDGQLLESLRIELIRIITLDITGYEAPLLKTGIPESADALRSLSSQLQPYLQPHDPRSDTLRALLDKAIAITDSSSSFNRFDRLHFLTAAALPLQRAFGAFIREKGFFLQTNKALDYDAPDLFSPDALSADAFGPSSPSDITLGKTLFFDPTLSGNGKQSCSSCHHPAAGFADRLPLSLAFDNTHHLDRNTPTLLYCGYQHRQFWDGRVHTLEEQIRTVLQDPREMNADTIAIEQQTGLPTSRIVTAIAAYVRSLHPMNSPFDRYMQGRTTALNTREIKGANLFMGKAQCATCHFIPLFNGLIPPDYAVTEFEVLGTTQTGRLAHPRLSIDQGRYRQYPFPFFKGAFKTPTVRNAALTAPYMHNGAYHDLKKLMEFYNKGGGAGLGLSVPDQTLPPKPLHLTTDEIEDLTLFINALTDSLNNL